MKEITVRDICGDYALDIQVGNNTVLTLYFNSRQNALNVKRIMEVDESVPNVATVCDMVEVVRCKDCVSSEMYEFGCSGVKRLACVEKEEGVVRFAQSVDPMGYCSGGKRKDGEGE